MNLSLIMQKYANEIDGRFIEYSDDNTIITIPMDTNRFQNVTGFLTERKGQTVVEFMSKVCDLKHDIDYRALLELNQELFYSKIIIYDGLIQVASSALFDHCTEIQIKDMISEVAEAADNLEFKLAGVDVY